MINRMGWPWFGGDEAAIRRVFRVDFEAAIVRRQTTAVGSLSRKTPATSWLRKGQR
jgi:hypothetical protein